MNNEYYGAPSTPNENFLAHYGIKGMKWGVRKAIEKGSAKKLNKQYNKAYKKLEKLNAKANIGVQNARAKKFAKNAAKSAGVALSGAGLHIGGMKFRDANRKTAVNLINKTAEQNAGIINAFRDNKITSEMADKLRYANWDKTDKELNKLILKRDIGKYANNIGAAVAGAGLIAGGVTGAKALAAKYRTTNKGHAKAVAKRDAWRNQMQDVFKNTSYSDLPAVSKNRSKKHRR